MHDYQLKHSQRKLLSPEGKAFLSEDILRSLSGDSGENTQRHKSPMLWIRLAEELRSRLPQLVELEALDIGKAIVNAEKFDIPFGIDCLRYRADLDTSTTRVTSPILSPQAR